MDVTRQSFNQALPRLLEDLAGSSFVALDLEFSGIGTRQPGATPGNGSSRGKQTLQAKYEEAKGAAEAYQVLQIGLTFAREDTETGTFLLRPYNLYLNPVLDPKLGVERRWSYQSSAVHFLMKNGFRMDAPFTDGLPYLSRLEETTAIVNLAEKEHNRATVAAIKLQDMDAESVEFLNEVRRLIDAWVNKTGDNEGYLNIPEPSAASDPSQPYVPGIGTVNNFQKRLIHQLVRAEYPDLVSIGRSTFIQIIPYDKQREEYFRHDKSRSLQEKIVQQTGFRWVVEGLVGGDLSNIDPNIFMGCPNSTHADGKSSLLQYSRDLQSKLKRRRPVLVGHNLFTDLINFYKCFIGDLPDRLEDFREAIHALFPLVIDTKYMATHKCSSTNPSSSLIEINDSLAHRKLPKISIDPEHDKYLDDKPLHEAGYDSLLTAKVLIRLSAQLHGGESLSRPDSWGSLTVQRTTRADSILSTVAPTPTRSTAGSIENNHNNFLHFHEPHHNGTYKSENKKPTSRAVAKQTPVNWNEESEFERIRSLFSTPPKRDGLDGSVGSQLADLDPNSPFRRLLIKGAGGHKHKGAQLIPRFSDEFWKIYGNKLRVFGTVEEVCDLDCDVRGGELVI
ncbi:hypothetical protein FQN52_006338 [Onygenales sp. PD_12]|nr:hypothetical protein FQN53_005938 [Emmonsiellopsis sp. PD_33]KAK2789246.1 hypothetical protein FQN52_006338 [Onygenales sp. PD_12]